MKQFPLILLLAAGCAGVPTTHELSSADHASAPRLTAPLAREGFRLEWEEADHGPGISVLLDEYARVTGQTVMMTADTRQVVRKKQLDKAGGVGVVEVAAEDVQQVTETLLAMHQLVLVPSPDAGTGIVQVVSLETQERSLVRRSAVYVPQEELEAWRGRAATLITTTLRLPRSDVRTLSNSMRTLMTDANTQQIVPAGSNTLILTGLGPDLCALADLLRRIDAEAETAAEPAPKPEGDQPR